MTDIALYVSSLRGGGAERVMVLLANGLAERGYKVDLVAASAQGPYRAEVSPSVNVVDLGAKRVAASLPGLVRYLRKIKPKSMLSAVNHANVIAVIARAIARVPTRLVVSEHNNLSQSRKRPKDLSGKVVQALMHWAYSRADAVVAVSKGVADDLAETLGFPRSRIEVVYNPVVTPKLFERAAASLDHPWLAPGEPPVVLGVGRLTPQKDFATLIKAFAQVRKQRDCRLVILGEGDLRVDLEGLIRDLNLSADVLLPGFSENPFAWMRKCDVFVLSSAWEGLPTVLIEALASGAKVISTDCPSGPSEILEDGKWGAIVPVGEVESLKESMDSALQGLGPENGVERAMRFGVEHAVSGYISVMRV